MKKFKFLSITILTLLSFAACGEKDVEREASPKMNADSNQVFFHKKDKSNFSLELEATGFDLSIMRKKKSSPAEIKIEISGPDADFFQITSATFKENEDSTTVRVTFPKGIDAMKNYYIDLKIEENQINPYSIEKMQKSLTIIQEDYKVVKTVRATKVVALFDGENPIDIEYSEIDKLFRIKPWGTTNSIYFTWDIEKGKIEIKKAINDQYISTGVVHPKYGSISAYMFDIAEGKVFEQSYDKATETLKFQFEYKVADGTLGVYKEYITLKDPASIDEEPEEPTIDEDPEDYTVVAKAKATETVYAFDKEKPIDIEYSETDKMYRIKPWGTDNAIHFTWDKEEGTIEIKKAIDEKYILTGMVDFNSKPISAYVVDEAEGKAFEQSYDKDTKTLKFKFEYKTADVSLGIKEEHITLEDPAPIDEKP